jgi:uncharacterized membrane protein YheB (UPF0754 family)
MRILLPVILVALVGPLMVCCNSSSMAPAEADFTRADSLTEHYLSLHDSVHQVWNIMINDDNQKINAMRNLLHELMLTHPDEMPTFKSLEERLDQLMRTRYTQKSMSNMDVVNEYDFASNSIISELLATARVQNEFSYNKTLQQLVADILDADARIEVYRLEYDSIVKDYNSFVEINRDYLLQTDETLTLETKPLFKIVSQE